jgi:hypothetical protein
MAIFAIIDENREFHLGFTYVYKSASGMSNEEDEFRKVPLVLKKT